MFCGVSTHLQNLIRKVSIQVLIELGGGIVPQIVKGISPVQG